MWIIGDVHGCLKSLQALVQKIGAPPEEICLVGDYVDRGPDDVGVIDYLMKGGFYCVRGNHEDLLLAHFADGAIGKYQQGIWAYNGGKPYLSWTQEHRDWLKSLPIYIEFGDEIRESDGRHLFVSHGCPHPARGRQGRQIWDDAAGAFVWEEHAGTTWDPYALMWDRRPPDTDPGRFFVYGHTPHKEVQLTSQYANVDTGCVHKTTGITPWGCLTALHWPSMDIIQQEYIG